MKDVNELLTQKEAEVARVRKEIESLQMVLPLLADDAAEAEPERKPVSNVQGDASEASSPVQATGTDDLFSSTKSGSRFWSFGRQNK